MLPSRIQDRVLRGSPTECWPWSGALNAYGYGVAWLNGNMRPVHRMMYEEAKGPIPEGLVLDHLCYNRNCSNPDHLEPVSRGENVRRGLSLDPDLVQQIQSSTGSSASVAAALGVAKSTVQRYRKGSTL